MYLKTKHTIYPEQINTNLSILQSDNIILNSMPAISIVSGSIKPIRELFLYNSKIDEIKHIPVDDNMTIHSFIEQNKEFFIPINYLAIIPVYKIFVIDDNYLNTPPEPVESRTMTSYIRNKLAKYLSYHN